MVLPVTTGYPSRWHTKRGTIVVVLVIGVSRLQILIVSTIARQTVSSQWTGRRQGCEMLSEKCWGSRVFPNGTPGPEMRRYVLRTRRLYWYCTELCAMSPVLQSVTMPA